MKSPPPRGDKTADYWAPGRRAGKRSMGVDIFSLGDPFFIFCVFFGSAHLYFLSLDDSATHYCQVSFASEVHAFPHCKSAVSFLAHSCGGGQGFVSSALITTIFLTVLKWFWSDKLSCRNRSSLPLFALLNDLRHYADFRLPG